VPESVTGGVEVGLISYFCRICAKSKPTQLADPVFGLITFGRGLWYGIADDGVRVTIWAGAEGPTDQQRAIFSTMQQRRAELNAAIEAPLFEEYRIIRAIEQTGYEQETPAIAGRFSEEFPEIQRPSEIWRIAHPARVAIYVEGYDFDFVFDFEMNWADNEHWLDVRFKDWKVIEVGKEG
jgi:hypothetical protein